MGKPKLTDIIEETEISDITSYLGKGSLIGGAIGGIGALVAAGTGAIGGWLAWLLVPLAAVAGGVVGDVIGKDGPIFGPNGAANYLKKPQVPGGVLAPNPTSMTYAESSKQIAANGSSLISLPYANMANGRFNLKDDPRLKVLEEKAIKYGQDIQRLPAGSPIEKIREREKAIMDKIIKDIGATYGEYSRETQNQGFNREELRAGAAHDNLQLKFMDKGSLVCRHYAPILSYLADKAGVPNHRVTLHTCSVRPDEDNPALIEFVESLIPEGGYHSSVLTDEGNAFVEGTTAGMDRAREIAYNPVLNGVDINGILQGKAALIQMREKGRQWIYGGHNGDGSSDVGVAMREAVRQQNEKTVQKAKEDFAKVTETVAAIGGTTTGISPMLNVATSWLAPAFTPPKADAPGKDAPSVPGK
jgi:hypothetical protein